MFALPRYALPRPTSLCRSVASTIHGSPDGASLSSTSGSPSSSSTPRTPRPRRSNVPLVDVDYGRPHLDLVAQSVVYCLRLEELFILTLTPSARRPDPISNLRPILYRQTDTPPAPRNPSLPPRPQPVPRPSHHSPTSEVSLSLAEFSKPSKEDPGKVFYRKDEFPREGDESDKTKEYRVVRETLDEYNQAFWVRSILFSTALLPVSSMTDPFAQLPSLGAGLEQYSLPPRPQRPACQANSLRPSNARRRGGPHQGRRRLERKLAQAGGRTAAQVDEGVVGRSGRRPQGLVGNEEGVADLRGSPCFLHYSNRTGMSKRKCRYRRVISRRNESTSRAGHCADHLSPPSSATSTFSTAHSHRPSPPTAP